MEQITLNKISAYELFASNDDRGFGSVIGYYKSSTIAGIDKKGKGYYGSDGEVKPVELYTDGKSLYQLQLVADGFTDEQREYKKEVMEKLKSKLSKDEIDFLGLS